MAKPIRMELGALQNLIALHQTMLGNAKIHAFKADGSKITVKDADKKAAIAALAAAGAALTTVCQQLVLAIEVEPD